MSGIYVMIGDFDSTIDKPELLLKRDGDVSVSLLRLDPAGKTFRENPRIGRLIEQDN